jgi:hypothetical protein
MNVNTGEMAALREERDALSREVEVLEGLVRCLYSFATERPAMPAAPARHLHAVSDSPN